MFHCLYLHPHYCRPGYQAHYISPPKEWWGRLPLACPWGHNHTLLPVVNILSLKEKMPALWVWSVIRVLEGTYLVLRYSLMRNWSRMDCAVLGMMFWNTGVSWEECRSCKLCAEFRACWRKALKVYFLTLKLQCSWFHIKEIQSARQCGQLGNLVFTVLLKLKWDKLELQHSSWLDSFWP